MSDDSWTSERRETVHEEARAVIDAQNNTMSDIDNKAIWTVRITAILIGLLVTGFKFAPDAFQQSWLEYAIGSFAIAGFLGILTYNESNLFVGPKGEYVEELARGTYEEEDWDEDLLITFAGMISENYDDIKWNARLLSSSLLFLSIGILLILMSIIS
jgi:hypothetical protein